MIKNKIKQMFPSRKRVEVRDELTQKLFFVHIPKTAGSSFRASFEKSSVTLKDYGNNSNSTSKDVQANVHDNKDFYALKTKLNQHKHAWLVGHVHLAKYIDFVPVTNTISFVREPLEQVLSHYNHYVKHHDFTGDLSAFLDKPFAKNLQSKFVDFMPLGLVGCLGLTEHYDESLSLINTQYALALPPKKINVNKTKQFTEDLLDSVLKDKFKKHNQQDIAMYEEAKYLHSQRVILSKESKSWTYGCAAINQHNRLQGCAYQYQSDEAISLHIRINDEFFIEVIAKDFYGAFVRANFPRDRYIGFNIALPKNISSEDIVDIYVEETGQKLNFKPLKVKS